MGVGGNVHEDALNLGPQGDRGVEPRQFHGALCYDMEQQGEVHVNCAFAKLMTGQRQVMD